MVKISTPFNVKNIETAINSEQNINTKEAQSYDF